MAILFCNSYDRDWIQEKKERRRRKGLETKPDSKFTGRKRAGRW